MVNTETIRRSQNSFAGGEISPKLLGRVDLAKFNTGLRYARNAFIEIEGAVSNRVGTEHGGRCKTDSGLVRYIKFEAPGDQNYILEFTPGIIRFIYNNQLVLTDLGGILEVSTPYIESELYELNYAQSNDIMTIVHQSHAPMELRRTAFNVFDLVGIVVNSDLSPPTISVVDSNGSAADETEQAYVVSSIDANGVEGLPSAKVTDENHLTNAGDFITIGWNEVTGADAYIIYKRRAGQYGFMGYIRAEDNETTGPPRTYRAIDNNINPNTAQTPKRADDPFDTAAKYPGVAFFFQQRRCFAASIAGPNTIVNSQIGVFDGFHRSIPGLPDDYFEFALGAARTQQIKHVIAVDDLIIFTASQEWRLRADAGYSAAQPPDVKPQSSNGVSDLPPIIIGTDIFYVQSSQRTVYRMNYSFDFNRFVSDDISILSKHLFKGRRIQGWCYAQQPNYLTFSYFDDGEGAFFAYNREQQVYAWSRFDTDGFVDAAESIRENGLDVVYLAVRRLVNGEFVRFFERMPAREFENITEAYFVDCGVKQSDYIGISDVAGGVVYTSEAHGLTTGDSIRLYDILGEDPNDSSFDINTRYKANVTATDQLTLLDYDTETAVDIDDFIYASGGKLRTLSNVITGLDHLEGRTVTALADGFVVKDLLVESGSVTLDFEAGIRIAGLPYTSEIHSLELEREDQPTRGRKKSVAALVARVEETRGIQIGMSVDKLKELKERDYEPYNDPVNPGSEVIRQNIGTGWTDEVKLIIRQDNPLPMTILSIIPEYTFGD